MQLPHFRPMFIRGLLPGHPGMDTIPYKTGTWVGINDNSLHYQIQLRLNTDIIACLGGKIVFAGEIRGGGNCIVLDCLDTDGGIIRFAYAHLSVISVAVGDFVVEGDKLGKMGYSGVGYADAHLHLTIVKNPTNSPDNPFADKGVIDPLTFFGLKECKEEGVPELYVKEGVL
mgnify:CR=1 FL=1